MKLETVNDSFYERQIDTIYQSKGQNKIFFIPS